MAELMSRLQVWIEQIINAIGYVGIALVMLAENLFPPIPSELVMPFAGFSVAQGNMNFIAVLVAGTIGAVLGALALYYVGVWADEPIARRFVRRYGRYFLLSESDLDRALDFFRRYGRTVVFFGRLIPIIRSLISIPAGMNRMPLGQFLLFTTLGSLIWNTVLTYAGVLLGANWTDVLGFVKKYETATLIVVLVAIIFFAASRIVRWRRMLVHRNANK